MRLLATVRARPEYLVGPILVLAVGAWAWTLDKWGVWGPAQGTAWNWQTVWSINALVPFTFAAAVVTIGVAFLTLRELPWYRRAIVALALPFAFFFGFEVLWDFLMYTLDRDPVVWSWFFYPITIALALVGLATGASTAIYWRVTRRVGVLVLAVAIGFVAWYGTGFGQVLGWDGGNAFAIGLNLFTKMGTAAIFVLMVWEYSHRPLASRLDGTPGNPASEFRDPTARST